MKLTSIKYLYTFLLSLLVLACGEGNNNVHIDENKNKSEVIDSPNCGFISSIHHLKQFTFQNDNNADTTLLKLVPQELFEFLFNDDVFPSPQTAYFVGKFEITNRTGVVTYALNKTESSKPMAFYQIHLLENCKNVYTDFLALNDEDVMIYETEGKLSEDFKTLTLVNTHSSYEVVGNSDMTNDTMFTSTYQIDLLTQTFNEEIQPVSIDTVAEYYYPNLTAWGGLTVRSKKGNLIEIEARQNSESNYNSNTYCFKDNKMIRIISHSHWNDENILSPDTYHIVDYNENLSEKSKYDKQLIKEGEQILDFLKKESVLPLSK